MSDTEQPTIQELEAACTDKERMFAREYVACLNATEAARRAQYQGSYGTLKVVASENRRKPHVQALITALLDEKIPTDDELLTALAEIIFNSSLEDFTTSAGRGTRIDLKKATERGKMHLAKSYSKGPKATKIEFYDKVSAIRLLMEARGMLIKKLELTGKDGTPLFPIPDLVAALKQAESELSNDAG